MESRRGPTYVVEVGAEGGHRRLVAGLTVLERCLRLLARQGAARAVVIAPPEPLPALSIIVEFQDDIPAELTEAPRVRGDEAAGIRVVDEASARRASWALCRALGKTHQGFIDALINWRLSSPVTYVLSSTRVMPNHVTLVSVAIGLVACYLAAAGRGVAALAAAGVLLQLQSVLDSVDGELSRLRFQGSVLGQWLDNLGDDVVDLGFAVACGVAAGMPWLAVAIGFAIPRAVAQGLVYREVYRKTGTGDVYAFRPWFQKDVQTIDEVFSRRSATGLIRELGRRDVYVFAWMIFCILGRPDLVVLYAAVLMGIVIVTMALHVIFTWGDSQVSKS
jgi:phosphatidylglycerophosphate synthase